MTPQKLKRLEALAAAATPGPWKANCIASKGEWEQCDCHDCDGEGEEKLCFAAPGKDLYVVVGPRAASPDEEVYNVCKADAEFIAAAREAIPELLAYVHELEERLLDLAD